jgi:MFS family permease
MQHSYDALDRTGGLSWVNPLAPLRHRDFRRLWIGMTASLIGDGVFLVAMAWQVYELSNAPAALSMVGIAMTVPTIVLLLFGGAVSDRVERRRVLIASDAVRGVAVAVMAALSLTGSLELWHMMALVACYGAGTAFFGPAFDAIVPDLLPQSELAQANALDQFVRPIAFRLAGPMLGGWMIAVSDAGTAFALDGVTFAVSAGFALSMRPLPDRVAGQEPLMQEIRAGLAFVRANVWIWGTLVSAAVAYLLFLGPTEVLLPFVVKNDLGGSAGDLGLVFGAGGLGAVLCALAMGTRGSPKRPILCIYVTWTIATIAVAGYGLAGDVWQLMAASFVFNALETAGTIVWATTKQRHVPSALLGRVSSLDWLISIGLLPVSFALTGPVAGAIGAQETLVVAGLLGAAVTASALLLPGMRDLDRPAEQDTASLPAVDGQAVVQQPGESRRAA